MNLYAVSEQALQHFVSRIREATDGSKPRMWASEFKSFEGFRPKPRLSGNLVMPPLTQVSYHTGPSLGWKDFDQSEPPSWGDPRLAWIMRQVAIESADVRMAARDDRFHATFCIWLEEQQIASSAEEQAEYERFRQELFYSNAPFPEEFRFLECQGLGAFLPHSRVLEMVSLERQVGFLQNAAARLSAGDWYSKLVGGELLRMRRFMEFVEADGSAIYYTEQQS